MRSRLRDACATSKHTINLPLDEVPEASIGVLVVYQKIEVVVVRRVEGTALRQSQRPVARFAKPKKGDSDLPSYHFKQLDLPLIKLLIR